MLSDAALEFSTAQALTATAASTNYQDLGSARNLGSGKPIHAYVSFDGVAPTGTTPTLTAALQGADDNAFSVNLITIAQATPTLVSGTVPTGNVELPIPSHTPKRYIRMYYTVAGTTPTMTVTGGIVEDFQTNPPPPMS